MIRHIFTYTARELQPFIDWSYFLHAWGIGNKQCDSEQALQIKSDAIRLLDEQSDSIKIRALFALCEAHSEGEDIVIENERLPLLRQQHNDKERPNLCLSDFISPKSDNIGLFATSIDEVFEQKKEDDDYRNILKQTMADRLVEAAALLTHLKVRTNRDLWGYIPEEQLTIEELLHEKNRGIRPAIGYPSLPDQSVIFIIDRLLRLKDIGIKLTENGAMHPHASVCGLMFAHPQARYFAVGNITSEQLDDYAIRRNIPISELFKFLSKNVK